MIMPSLCDLQMSRERERKKQKNSDTTAVVSRDFVS